MMMMQATEIAQSARRFSVMVRVQGPDPKGLKMRNHAFHLHQSGNTSLSASGLLLPPGSLREPPQILEHISSTHHHTGTLVVTVASVIEPFLTAQHRDNPTKEFSPKLIPGACIDVLIEGRKEGNNHSDANTIPYWVSSQLLALDHRVDFEPFIEDEVPFDKYCQSMGKDGTWAGHMELQAASLVTRRNICIHQAMSPRWYIRNFNGKETSMIHLSYHDGEHYNSVRLVEDSCEGPAIVIKVDTNISAVDTNKKVTVNELRGSFHNCLFDSGAVKLVIAGTGCTDVSKTEQVQDCPADDHDGKSELPGSSGNGN